MAEETKNENVQPESASAPDAPAAPITGTAPGQASGQQAQPQSADQRAFTQADVDRIVKERLEREQGKATKAAEKARQEAEAKALVEQGDFKKLSETQAARIVELEATAEEFKAAQAQLKRYETALKESLAAQLAGVPEHIKSLLDRMDVTEQMTWLSANQDKLKPAQPAAAAPDISATKRSTSPQTKMSDDERREFAARYGVRPEYLPS